MPILAFVFCFYLSFEESIFLVKIDLEKNEDEFYIDVKIRTRKRKRADEPSRHDHQKRRNSQYVSFWELEVYEGGGGLRGPMLIGVVYSAPLMIS